MSAFFLPNNMHIRYNSYHYRRRIPADLVDLFGKKEATKSLHTKKPVDAVRMKNRLDGLLEQLFQACRLEAISSESAISRLQAILQGRPQPTIISPDSPTAQVAPITIISSRRRGKRLSDAVEAYIHEHQNGWTTKTAKEFSSIYDKMIMGLSDPWLQDIDRPSLVEYRDKLTLEGKHVKTVNKYLQMLSTVLRHAGRLKWITGNPAEGLGLKDTRREDEIRKAFTLSEINQIFLALQSAKKTFYDSDRHERYWLPLLGMYTGARVNELAQLTIDDIKEDNGIPAIVISIGGDDSKRIKSESSRRTLPLHNDLLTLGFLVYVRSIKEKGHDRIFPALRLGPNGYSHYFVSHHFSGSKGWLHSTIPTLPEGVSFHCFRHTVATMLKNAEEPERLIEEILGHKHSSLALGRYGKPYDLDIKARAVNKIHYNLIPAYKTVTGQVEIEDDNIVEVEYVVCGDFNVQIDSDERKAPLEVRQYLRPDKHGYSIFHGAIPSFQQD
ncbi:MAG: site-specific integrase [Desulfuromonadales bacterium]|nr:site-specific integrase [Desulfuromonadales bacterium]